jgi:hypothetical protein
MSRKPRSDSKLLTLPQEQQVIIFDWLKTGLSYSKAKLKIKKEFSVVTSESALTPFWVHWSGKESEERILRAVTSAEDVVETVAGNLPLLNQAAQAALQQATFEAIMSGADPKVVKDYSNILLKSRALDQADQTLALRLREFEQKIADAQDTLSKAKADGGMTVEAIEQMEQQLGLL